MIRRLTEIVKGFLALASIATLVAGVPWMLYRYGGSPGSPILDTFSDPLTSDSARSERFLAGTLGIIAWLCWAQVAYALVAEILATARGTVANRAPLLPGIQAAAARLVASATLVMGSFGQAATVIAAPLVPMVVMEPAIAAPLEIDADIQSADRQNAAPAKSHAKYTTVDRDTFWSVAEATLGDGLRWSEVRDANIGRTMPDGTTIQAATEELGTGWDLTLPTGAVQPLEVDDSEVESSSQAVSTDDWIEVDHGEHFWSIAEEALTEAWGRPPTDSETSQYWADLVETNEGRLLPPDDPNLIYPEQRFQLPPMPLDPAQPELKDVVAQPLPAVDAEPEQSESVPEPVRTTIVAPPATSEAKAPSVQEASSGDAAVPLASVALGIGGVGVGAGALAVALRRHRANRAAKRKPGTTLQPPTDELIEYEQRTRPVADTEAARWVAATNKLITARLASQKSHRLPAVVAMRAGRFGVEVLLDEPCAPLEGFVPGNSENSAWRLHPDLELRMIEAETEDAQPYSPSLVAVGSTEAGDLLLDLEQLGVLSVEGDDETAQAWFRSIASSVSVAEWSKLCDVVIIGAVPGIEELAQVTVPDDGNEWAAETAASMRKLHDRLRATPYEQRVSPGEVFHPTVVLISGDNAEAARTLSEVATLVNTPLAVVATCPLPVAERVHLDERRSTLEPIGVDFEPALTSAPEVYAVADLLDNAEHALVGEEPESILTEQSLDDDREPLAELIDRVMTPKPIEVYLLESKPSVQGLENEPPAKQLSVICYLAYHRSVTSQRLRDTFWPSASSRKTADNAISQIRSMLGLTDDGEQRLTQAINTGENELSEDVGCDWPRAEELIQASHSRPDRERIELLRTAIGLVRGQIGADAPARQFAWLVEDHQVYGHMERVLLDAAAALGELALGSGDPCLADHAAEMGLRITPGSEAMYRLRMKAAASRGDDRGVVDAFTEAAKFAEGIDPWSDVDSETAALWKKLDPSQRYEAS